MGGRERIGDGNPHTTSDYARRKERMMGIEARRKIGGEWTDWKPTPSKYRKATRRDWWYSYVLIPPIKSDPIKVGAVEYRKEDA